MSFSEHETSEMPSTREICEAAQAVGVALGQQIYAVVGGAALALLGSNRRTTDLDFVVPRGETKSTRMALRQQGTVFEVQPKTLHTVYLSTHPVPIDILTPPLLFKLPFDESTPTIYVRGAKVLKPTLILNAKCDSIAGRSSVLKSNNDSADIKYLLRWFLTPEGRMHGSMPSALEVPHASGDFVEWFIHRYQDRQLWVNAGFDFEQRRFP